MPQYEELDRDGFPATYLSPLELLYFRNWQAQGLVWIAYYFVILYAAFYSLLWLIEAALISAWTLFATFPGALMNIVLTVLVARIVSELVLSVFVIRNRATFVNGLPEGGDVSGQGQNNGSKAVKVVIGGQSSSLSHSLSHSSSGGFAPSSSSFPSFSPSPSSSSHPQLDGEAPFYAENSYH